MNPPPTLFNMPDLVLVHIANNLNCIDVQCIRKTCRKFKLIVDHYKIDPGLNYVCVSPYNNRTDRCCIVLDSANMDEVQIIYKQKPEGCFVRNGLAEEDVYLGNQDFATVAGRDLGSILRWQTTILKKLKLTLPKDSDPKKHADSAGKRFLDSLVKQLETMHLPLAVEKFKWGSTPSQDLLMIILPILDHTCLKNIDILDNNKEQLFEIDRIVDTAQWENARKGVINVICDSRLENFHHFKDISLRLKEVSREELNDLLEDVMNQKSSHRYHSICYETFFGSDDFEELYGKSMTRNGGESNAWYFRKPNSKKTITLEHNKPERVIMILTQSLNWHPDYFTYSKARFQN